MRCFVAVLVLLVVGIRAEAAYIPAVPQCQVLATHVDVAECFGVLNMTHKPDTTTCGPLDLLSIMRSVDVNNSSLVGSTWQRLGALVLDQCGYSAEAKDAFLGLETTLFGGLNPVKRQLARGGGRSVLRRIGTSLTN